MAIDGNTDIYVVDADGGLPAPADHHARADTSPSFSPDGRRIVFESDRSGTQQLYVMDADGSGQRRISFGGGRYASPAGARTATSSPSPAGPVRGIRIGVMTPSGSGREDAHRRLAGRRPELGPRQPIGDVPPHCSRARARPRSTPSRSTAASRKPMPTPRRRIRPRAGRQLTQ